MSIKTDQIMQRARILFLITTTLFIFNNSYSQDAKDMGLEAITKQAVQGQLEFLASDWTEGRHTGRPGAYMAADYIASLFQVYGLQPAGDMEWNSVPLSPLSQTPAILWK